MLTALDFQLVYPLCMCITSCVCIVRSRSSRWVKSVSYFVAIHYQTSYDATDCKPSGDIETKCGILYCRGLAYS